jgi:hypothetical protein
VQQPAVAALVSEYVFDAIRNGEEPQSDIAEALRIAIDEVIKGARADDWERVGRDLIAWARAFLEPASDAPAADALWPRPAPPDAIVVRQRKHPVRIDQSAVLAWMHDRGDATLREIAQHFSISEHSARGKADGLVAPGKLTVTPGSLSSRTQRCYSEAAVGSGLELSRGSS